MTQEGSKSKPPSNIFLIYIVILAAILVIGLITGSLFKPAGESASTINLTILIGGFILLTGILIFFRFLNRAPTPIQRKVITTLQCAKCAFKSIRNFQPGDYIPKTVGTCPTCGGSFIVDAIYVEPPQQK